MLTYISSPWFLAFLIFWIIVLIGLMIRHRMNANKINLTQRLQFDQSDINAQEIIRRLEAEEESFAKKNRKDFFGKKEEMLLQSGTNITIQNYMLFMVASGAILFVLTLTLTRSWFFAIISIFAGYFIPDKIVNFKRERNIVLFNNELVKALRRMSAVLRSGGSAKQAIEDVTKAKTIPIYVKMEFQKILTDLEYGKSIEDAMFSVHERTGSTDVRYLAIAIEIQRRLGGNLAVIFDTVTTAITTRNFMESTVRAIMAENKSTSIVLTVMPIAIFLGISIFSPDYFDPLYANFFGKFILMACFGMIGTGAVILAKMARVDR